MLPLSVALSFFNISVSVMCEKCIFALYIYDNIFRVTIDATIYTNTLCSNEDYEMYETHTNSQCERRYFDTYAKSFSPFSIEKPSRSVYRNTSDSTNENATRGTYTRLNVFLSREKVSVTCAKMYVLPDKLRRSSIPTY